MRCRSRLLEGEGACRDDEHQGHGDPTLPKVPYDLPGLGEASQEYGKSPYHGLRSRALAPLEETLGNLKNNGMRQTTKSSRLPSLQKHGMNRRHSACAYRAAEEDRKKGTCVKRGSAVQYQVAMRLHRGL